MKAYLDKTFPGLRAKARRMGAVIYFVDEASVRSDSHRGTTWGKIGQTPEVQDSGDRFSLRLISAVSPRGDMKFTSFTGKMNGARFVDFVKKLQTDTGGPVIVIADNASYHTSGVVKRYVADSKGQVTVASLPRYSPELNPQEHVWDELREKEFPNRVFDSIEGVLAQLNSGLPRLAANTQALRSLTAWPWIISLILKAS